MVYPFIVKCKLGNSRGQCKNRNSIIKTTKPKFKIFMKCFKMNKGLKSGDMCT